MWQALAMGIESLPSVSSRQATRTSRLPTQLLSTAEDPRNAPLASLYEQFIVVGAHPGRRREDEGTRESGRTRQIMAILLRGITDNRRSCRRPRHRSATMPLARDVLDEGHVRQATLRTARHVEAGQ